MEIRCEGRKKLTQLTEKQRLLVIMKQRYLHMYHISFY